LGRRVVNPLCETWRAVKKKIPAGRAIMPITKAAAKIHQIRLREDSPDVVLGNEPP
jgi:hypothetical protein